MEQQKTDDSDKQRKKQPRKCNLCRQAKLPGKSPHERFCGHCKNSVRYRSGELASPYDVLLQNAYRGY